MARELGEIAMALARAAADRALRAWGDAPDAGVGSPASPGTPADTAVETQAEGAVRPAPDHALVFARLSRAVRQTIALEARIAAGTLALPQRRSAPFGMPPAGRQSFAPDRRRPDQMSDAELDRALSFGLLREIAERLDDDPAIEPRDLAAIAETLSRACDELGIGSDAPPLPPSGGDAAADPPAAPAPVQSPPGAGSIRHARDPAPPPEWQFARCSEPPGRDPP